MEVDRERLPVIVGVGELADRPSDPGRALDPGGLMATALRRAERDAGVPLVAALDRLDLINEISWPYLDPVAEVTARIGRPGLPVRHHPVGGQTPLLAIHEAALAIQAGEAGVCAVVGGEAEASVRAARRRGVEPPWPPRDTDHRPVRGGDHQGEVARALELTSPVHVYPLYENALREAWGQGFAEAQAESAAIWAANARVARRREAAWIRRDVAADDILSGEDGNRLIAWPYRKLMVANPLVNQGAAVILCSAARARELGVPDDRRVYVRGGAAADEPRDILKRRTYTASTAMDVVLRDAVLLATENYDAVELYSCFPCVPKMARRTLGLRPDRELSVAGGMTFFGAPLNDYMTHAAVAMTERLRASGGAGLLYGQGEYVTKHHALLLSAAPGADPLDPAFRRTDVEAALAEAAPPPAPADYAGPAAVETHTVLFDRDARVRHGVAVLRTPQGARLAARVEPGDAATLAALMGEAPVIGREGRVRVAEGVAPVFALAGT